MTKSIPFYTSVCCDTCNIKGAYGYQGQYLCERCSRDDDIQIEYDEDKHDRYYCPCTNCKCANIENWIWDVSINELDNIWEVIFILRDLCSVSADKNSDRLHSVYLWIG